MVADENESVTTSMVTFVETEHGRTRRHQRGISKRDLQKAKKHGSEYLLYGKDALIIHNGLRTLKIPILVLLLSLFVFSRKRNCTSTSKWRYE